MRACKGCEQLSDLLFAANQREGKRIKEAAAMQTERDQLASENVLLRSRILQMEAQRQVGS